MKFSARIALIAFLLSGCSGASGPSLQPVTGTLTKGGKPLPNVQVTFTPEAGLTSAGQTNAEGKFVLISQTGRAGAIAGKHKVTLMDIEDSALSGPIDMSNPATMQAMMKQRDANMSGGKKGAPKAADAEKSFPSEYGNPAKTPFEFTIESGGGAIDLAIP